MNHDDVLFFTFADEGYEKYVVPYIYFALRSNAKAYVEIRLADFEGFVSRHREAVEALDRVYAERYQLTQSVICAEQIPCVPNTIRFIEQPKRRAEWVYIGDIDLFVTDDIVKVHTDLIESFGLKFSNIIRPGPVDRPRLSGLHFCRYDDYYPVADYSDIAIASENDEHVLYRLMEKKGLMVPKTFSVRPECGVHLSLNRDMLGRTSGPMAEEYKVGGFPGWGDRSKFSRFVQLVREPEFLSIWPWLDVGLRAHLLGVEAIQTGRSRALHREFLANVADRRLIISSPQRARRSAEVYSNYDTWLENPGDTLDGCMEGAVMWPKSAGIWSRLAIRCFLEQRWLEGIESAQHAVEVSAGIAPPRLVLAIEKWWSEIELSGSRGRELLDQFARLGASKSKLHVIGPQRAGTGDLISLLSEAYGSSIVPRGDRNYFWRHSLPGDTAPNASRTFSTALGAARATKWVEKILVVLHPATWLHRILLDAADLRQHRGEVFDDAGRLKVQLALEFWCSFYSKWIEVLGTDGIRVIRLEDVGRGEPDWLRDLESVLGPGRAHREKELSRTLKWAVEPEISGFVYNEVRQATPEVLSLAEKFGYDPHDANSFRNWEVSGFRLE